MISTGQKMRLPAQVFPEVADTMVRGCAVPGWIFFDDGPVFRGGGGGRKFLKKVLAANLECYIVCAVPPMAEGQSGQQKI
jgi:hypothetical protein